MFVMDVLKDDGRVDRSCLPIYGTLFGDDELMALLGEHLAGLQIARAKQVQVVADGSPWIWNGQGHVGKTGGQAGENNRNAELLSCLRIRRQNHIRLAEEPKDFYPVRPTRGYG